jgi:hypothetical protein
MDRLADRMNPLPLNVMIALAVGLVALILIVWMAVRAWRRHRAGPKQVFKRISAARLVDVLIPDGLDGEIHLDHLLLTGSGILVVDLRNASGAVFAGEQMDDWTVLSSERRYTFRNPLEALAARVHAVRRLADKVPVTGRVVFVGDVEFAGGQVPGVVTLAELESEFGHAEAEQARQSTEAFRFFWTRIDEAAKRYAA